MIYGVLFDEWLDYIYFGYCKILYVFGFVIFINIRYVFFIFVVNCNWIKMNNFNFYNDFLWWDCIIFVLSDLWDLFVWFIEMKIKCFYI